MSAPGHNFFSPLTGLYGVAVALRNRLFDWGLMPVTSCSLPVISVGNLTAGGNSKTPLCMYLVEKLKVAGRRPVVLSRGYKGSAQGPLLVSADDEVSLVGDEPAMLARWHGISVVVAKDRVAGSDFVRRNNLGDVIVLDDGFQHRRLARDVDIVCVDVSTAEAVQNFMDGRLLPVGRFREQRDQALRRAQVLVLSARQPEIMAASLDPSLAGLWPPGLRVFRSFVQPEGVFRVTDGTELIGREALAFCAIAGPQGFFQTLAAMNFRLTAAEAFPDHSMLRDKDLQRLRRLSPGQPLICTEKDAVRFAALAADDVYMLKVRLVLEPEQEFLQCILPKG